MKAFIRSLGQLAKTDALDAAALARYGQERHDRLPRWCPRDANRQLLATLVATRTDLVRARTALIALLPELGTVDRRHTARSTELTTESMKPIERRRFGYSAVRSRRSLVNSSAL